MTPQANLLRISEAGAPPCRSQPSAEIISLAISPAPARYGEGRRPNMLALAISIGIVGILLWSLFTMNVISPRKAESSLTVIELLRAPEPPPPPPPSQQPEPEKHVSTPSPIVAPVPVVMPPPSPLRMATSLIPPPPQVTVTGPPATVPAPAPAIESAGDLSSTMVAAVPPRYPHESRRKREQGTVVLMVLLGIDGSVADLSISQSSGYERLDRAALTAVRRWRWSPTRRNGTPVMVRGLVEIPFILQE